MNAGYRTGAFTSPHFLRFNERIRVGGDEALDEEIVAAFAAIEQARGDISLTYFEFAALAALWIFRQRRVEYVVLEVGLGGRLDAVNMVDPRVAVITSIDLDHQEWLGDTRGAIAQEKAGIMRPASPGGDRRRGPAAGAVTVCRAGGRRARWFASGSQFSYVQEDEAWQATFAAARDAKHGDLPLHAAVPLCSRIIFVLRLQAASLLGVEFGDRQLQRALAVSASHAGAGRRLQRGG